MLGEEGTLALGPFIGAIVATETEWEVREDGDEGTDNPGDWQYTRDGGATWIPLNAVGNDLEIEMDGFYGLIGACLHF